MKSLLKMALVGLVLALPKFVMAERYLIPQDSHGNIPSDANLVGVDVIDSTSTVNTGLTSPVLLYWVMVSSDAATNYATLRDSATLNSTSNVKLTVYPNNTSGTSLASGSVIMNFNPPVIFRNGLSITLNAAPAGGGALGRWHFGIRRRVIGNANGQDTSFADTGS